MIRALWSAASGMGAQQLKLDVIANNLANVNTVGFKASRVEFQDVFYTHLRPPDDPRILLQVGHGVMPAEVVRSFAPGLIEQTGHELHVAIEGQGFFILAGGQDGAEEYSRDGSFRLDQGRRLVTADGQLLQSATGTITIPPEALEVTIAADGRISAQLASGATQAVGRLQLATFANPAGLAALGHNVYRATGQSGAAVPQWPGQGQAGVLRQGAVERSNVQLIDEIVGLMTAQRAYELNSKVIHCADEMMGMANNLRR